LANSKTFTSVLSAIFLAVSLAISRASALTSPADFLGYRVGEDRKLARYDRVITYLKILSEESERVNYEIAGSSTQGNPLVLTVISSARNMKKLEKYREISRLLADPRKTGPTEAARLVEDGKVFLLILANQHSTEIASSNMVMELAYDLASGDDPVLERALEDVVVMIVPSANPDGQMKVVDYYEKYLGTPYEGGDMPWLYHNYAGHDLNRDWFILNLAETDALVDVLYGNWYTQVIVDVHQMGMTGVRMFVPPFYDPPNPNNHYLIWNQIELLGSYMKFALAEAGKKGVIDHAYYSGWYQGSVRPNATQHNITALLTETAGVRIASPVFIDHSELSGTDQGLPDYEMRMNFTDPWPGGWWRLRDIVEYQLVAFKALVDECSRHRGKFLWNFYRMGLEASRIPEQGAPFAYLIPPHQFDPGSTGRLLKIFERTKCEIHQAASPFVAESRQWPEGTVVLKVGQPYGRFVKDLLELKTYPDMRRYPNGPPVPPYDNAAWTLSLLMGVEVVEVHSPFQAELKLLDKAPLPEARAQRPPVLFDCRDVNSYRALNRLIAAGAKVYRYEEEIQAIGRRWPAGCFLAEASFDLLRQVADTCRVAFYSVGSVPAGAKSLLKPGKIGVYRGWIPSTDEGWTRYVLDRFDFPHEQLSNERVRKGSLQKDYSVVILPSLSAEAIINGYTGETMPQEYRGGIGREGVKSLKDFVRQGGTLIALREACHLAMNEFDIPVRDAFRTEGGKDFFCPGSLLKLEIDPNQPVGYGSPEKTAGFFAEGVVLATSPPQAGDIDRRVVARYGKENILLSGWLLGERNIQGMPAVVDVTLGDGNVVLCGLGVQNRAETWGTFKLLFNAILYGYQ